LSGISNASEITGEEGEKERKRKAKKKDTLRQKKEGEICA